MTTLIVVPYLGPIPSFGLLSLRTLASDPKTVRVILVSDQPDPQIVGVEHQPFDDVFDTSNRLGILAEELKAFPYKLCDLKPFLNLLFPSTFTGAKRWGWADIDVLYAAGFVQRLDNFGHRAPPGIWGRFGHLMWADEAAFGLAQQVFFRCQEKIGAFKMFDVNRHFALDEFLFLHVVLEKLDTAKRLVWFKDVPERVGDIEPYGRDIVIDGKQAKRFYFEGKNLLCEFPADAPNCFDYVHFQKRFVDIDVDTAMGIPIERLSFSQDRSGNIQVTDAHALSQLMNSPRKSAFSFSVEKHWRRAMNRLRNHGLSRRPRLDEGMVSSVVEELQ